MKKKEISIEEYKLALQIALDTRTSQLEKEIEQSDENIPYQEPTPKMYQLLSDGSGEESLKQKLLEQTIGRESKYIGILRNWKYLSAAAIFTICFGIIAILLAIFGTDDSQAQAYNVTLEKNGMYAQILPDTITENASPYFKKAVKKALKYQQKYQDADIRTFTDKVPNSYRDFIPIAQKIKPTDEITIKNPFYIYNVTGDGYYDYYFLAERNGKKLCLFSIGIDPFTGKANFYYEKMLDQYFLYDEKLAENAIFYKKNDITYAQTPEELRIVRDQHESGISMMAPEEEYRMSKMIDQFEKKTYEEKKEEIFAYLSDIKNRKSTKIAEKDIKKTLKDEYITPKSSTPKNLKIIRAGIIIMIIAIGGITIWFILRKKH